MIVLVKIFQIIKLIKTQLMLGFLLLTVQCGVPYSQTQIEGETMGTTYNIKIVSDYKINYIDIKSSVDSIFVVLNQQMSTWDPESEISKFNRWESLDPYNVSGAFFKVVEKGLDLSQKTDGMFDITVYDLLSLWGFGPNPKSGIPKKKQIESILLHTGYENIICNTDNLIKKDPRMKIDLNSIAKGYGVDVVFDFLKSKGFENIFVEVGGEVRYSGHNRKYKNWSLGLENPLSNTVNEQKPFFGILDVESSAVATSANYRNFVDLDGTILGHTINPKSGFPVQSDIISVTVIAETCMEADGWATALMVMNHNEGARMLEKNKNISAIWLLQEDDGTRYISTNRDQKIVNPIYDIR